MSDFELAFPIIRKYECAPQCIVGNHQACFTDDPQDPGGATCCGIIQRTYDAYRDSKGLPHQPIQNHSSEERSEIYKIRFWDKAKCEEMPWPLNLIHFDAAVNHGTEPKDSKGNIKISCGRLLQLAFKVDPVDGIIGGQTLWAVTRAKHGGLGIKGYCYRYLIERFLRYDDLAKQNPNLIKFDIGAWQGRLKDLYSYVTPWN